MKKIFAVLIFLFLLSFAERVFADNIIEKMIKEAIEFIRNVALLAAVIIIVIGGYFMITSAGDPNKFETGKKTLLYGAIGLILILIAETLAGELIKIMEK